MDVARVGARREGTSLAHDRTSDPIALFDANVAGRLDASYRLATIILGDPSEAEDATQDAIVTAWRRYGDLRDPLLFDRWFGRIVVNTCRDRLRRRRRWYQAIPTLVRPSPDPIGQVNDRDEIGRAFRSLPIDDRIVLALRHAADLPIADIAERLSVPVGTAKSRLHRATAALRTALSAEDVDR